MISHTHRVIFIHQRKCAGMSVMRALGGDVRDPDFHRFNDGTLSSGGWGGRWGERSVEERGYLVVTCVRNPWDRFVSGWKYLRATRERPLAEVVDDLPREGHDYRHLTRPQLDILIDDDGHFVPDVVLRYETLERDFRALAARLGLAAELPHVNRTRHAPWWTYYDASTRDRVGELFARDVEFFGYAFEPPAEEDAVRPAASGDPAPSGAPGASGP